MIHLGLGSYEPIGVLWKLQPWDRGD